MNKAIEILTDWIYVHEKRLEILKDLDDTQKYWITNGDAAQINYYTAKNQNTQKEIEELIKGISECKQALAKVEEGNNQ
ncbi:hypothetical protein [Paenibacillus sp. FSL R10-2771]|uniref:hypothetical protein n=1 Tax=Paenibacillus sp. FSL R10-2771 TaxID=2954693 RepID=UPI0030FA7EC4